MTGHTDVVTNVAFSPDGHRIISNSLDQTVRLWDADAERPIGAPMTSHPSAVASVAFSPDGQHIVTKNWGGTRRLWPAPADADWPALVCDKLTHNMSHKQWREWVSTDIDYVKVCPDLPVAPD